MIPVYFLLVSVAVYEPYVYKNRNNLHASVPTFTAKLS